MDKMDPGLWALLGAIVGLSIVGFGALVYLGYRNNNCLNKGEMRRAVTAFFIILFGFVALVSFFPTKVDVPKEIQGLFVGVITSVIGFYFGWRGTASSGSPTDGANGGSGTPQPVSAPESSSPPGAEQ